MDGGIGKPSRVKRKALKKPAGVVEKRVRAADGTVSVKRILDPTSPTLREDLLYVFRRNVAKARRDNKRILGVADFATTKR